MLCADISFTTEGILVISGLLGALATAVVYLHKLYVKSMEDRIIIAAAKAELEDAAAMQKTLKGMADEALASAIQSDNKRRRREGKPPLIVPEAVIPEGNSPPTDKQRLDAWIATRRAAMVALKEGAGQEPRHEPGSIAEEARQAQPTGEVQHTVPIAVKVDELADKAREVADLAVEIADEVVQPPVDTPPVVEPPHYPTEGRRD